MEEETVSLLPLALGFSWPFVRSETLLPDATSDLTSPPARVRIGGEAGGWYGSGFPEPVLGAVFTLEGREGGLEGNSSRGGLSFALCFGFVLGAKVGGLKTFSRLIGLKRSHWSPGAMLPCSTLLFHSGVACGFKRLSGDGREFLC